MKYNSCYIYFGLLFWAEGAHYAQYCDLFIIDFTYSTLGNFGGGNFVGENILAESPYRCSE